MLKFWKGANIRLVNVVSGINRVSFQKLFEKIIPDDLPDTYRVSSLIYKKLLSKLPELIASSEDIVISLHRNLLSKVLNHNDVLNEGISVLDTMVKDYMTEYGTTILAIDELSERQAACHALLRKLFS